MRALQIAAPVLGLAMIGAANTAPRAQQQGQPYNNQNQQQGQPYNQNQQGQPYNGNQGGNQPYNGNQPYGQRQGGWDNPPNDFQDAKRQGFHDGIQAARQDFQNQRQRPAEAHRQYRFPQVGPDSRDDYREGFRRGYTVATQHMQNGNQGNGFNPH